MNDAAPWASLFIVTCNSARWLGPVLKFHHGCGLAPTFLLDAKSSDGTEALLRAYGAPYTVVEGGEPRVEAFVSEIAKIHPRGWVLRLDDDEAPSRGLLAFLQGPPPSSSLAAIALPRWHLRRDADGRTARGRWTAPFFRDQLEHDWQWRLFQPDRVAYTSDIHTPGFLLPEQRGHAPTDAVIAHLVWIVRSVEERRRKIEAYDAQKPGAGSFFQSLYVPEDAGDAVAFDPVDLADFDPLIADIAGASR